MEKTKISSRLKENEAYVRARCENCADILIRPMRLGKKVRWTVLWSISKWQFPI